MNQLPKYPDFIHPNEVGYKTCLICSHYGTPQINGNGYYTATCSLYDVITDTDAGCTSFKRGGLGR